MAEDFKARRKTVEQKRKFAAELDRQFASYHSLQKFLQLTYEISDIAYVLALATVQREEHVARRYAIALIEKVEEKKRILKRLGYEA